MYLQTPCIYRPHASTDHMYLRTVNTEESNIRLVPFSYAFNFFTIESYMKLVVWIVLSKDFVLQETDFLREDDIALFYKVWMKFDPHSTQFIMYKQLSEFLDTLEPPLRISKPNKIAISILNINVSTGKPSLYMSFTPQYQTNF